MPSRFCEIGVPDTGLKCNTFINLEEILYMAIFPLSFLDTTITAANVNLTATWSGVITNTDNEQKGFITPEFYSWVQTPADGAQETSESGRIAPLPRQNGTVNVMWRNLDRVSHNRLLDLRNLGNFKYVLFNKNGQMFAAQDLSYPAYDVATAYAIDDIVVLSDRTWKSLTAANTGNDPLTDPVNWVQVYEPKPFVSSTLFDVAGDRNSAGNTANDKIGGQYNILDASTKDIEVWDASTPFNELFGATE